jgi:hypothetical protein
MGEYFVIGIGKFVVLLVRIFEREIVILNCDLLCFLLLLSGRRAVVSYNPTTTFVIAKSAKSFFLRYRSSMEDWIRCRQILIKIHYQKSDKRNNKEST